MSGGEGERTGEGEGEGEDEIIGRDKEEAFVADEVEEEKEENVDLLGVGVADELLGPDCGAGAVKGMAGEGRASGRDEETELEGEGREGWFNQYDINVFIYILEELSNVFYI